MTRTTFPLAERNTPNRRAGTRPHGAPARGAHHARSAASDRNQQSFGFRLAFLG